MPVPDLVRRAVAVAADGLATPGDLDHAVQRRLFGVLSSFMLVLFPLYAVLHGWQGRWTLALLAATAALFTAGCVWWARHGGRYLGPLRAVNIACFALLAWVTLQQGPTLPAAGWWLSIVPFLLAGGGLYYLAIGSVFAFIALVSWMQFAPASVAQWIPQEAAIAPWRHYTAIIGSEMLALLVVIVAMRQRAQVARALEQARAAATEAAAAKARFLATMSHEIRTPLNGVVGVAELLESPRLSDAQRLQLVALQRQSARTLLTLLNNVLDFAKLEAGRLVLERQPVPLRRLVFEANELFSVQAFAKDLELTSSCNPDVPKSFVGDALRLRQIVHNLVSNAVKFTERGGVHLHLSLDPPDPAQPTPEPGQRWVRIEVVDSGPGIAPEVQASLFNAFQQADASIARQHGGTGLGLAIAQDLAQLMHGRIELRSQPGQGSCFALVVPLAPATPDSTPPPLPSRRRDVVLCTDNRGLERHLKSLLHELRVDPVVLPQLPPAAELAHCRLLLLDAPLLQAHGARAWLHEQAVAGCKVVVLTPLGTDAVLGPMEDALVVYKPVRRKALQAVLAATVGTPLAAESDAARSPEPSPSALHVLVAEDNPVNQVVVQAMLAELGATCTVAADGREALACALAEPFDLVLMDLHMPHMDGLDATRALRREEAVRGTPHMLVCAMTAHTEGDEGDACQAAGMDLFLAKPFNLPQLKQLLATAAELRDPFGRAREVGPSATPSH